MCSTFMVVLLWSSGSSSNLFPMMVMADSIGTDVNSAETSYEVIHSVGCSLKTCTPPRSNINREEVQALAELRRDSSKVILTADKGVALVIMDRPEYINKVQELLNDNKTYKEISTDPTNKLKTKLISLLKKIKADGGIEEQLYQKMYPTGAVAPKFYGLPKIHKRDIPLRPIVLSRGSISYEVAKELSRILRQLVGKSPQHIKKLVTLYSKSEGSNYNQQNILLHMMSQHYSHQCLWNLPLPS